MDKDTDQQNATRDKIEELEDEEEEIKRISRLNPPTSCGRDQDRFATK